MKPTSVLCWAAKWLDDDRVFWQHSIDSEGQDFVKMIRGIHKLLSEADAVCHFNGRTFDMPRLNNEFVRLGMSPPPPIPQIDLKTVVMSKFDMTSSKLAFVGPYLKIGEKVKNSGWELWLSCMDGDKEAWRLMEKYNKQDVVLLERLYKKVLPWIDNHPNRGLVDNTENEARCPNCGATKLAPRGHYRTQTMVYRRYQCQGCMRWSRGRVRSKHHEPAAYR